MATVFAPRRKAARAPLPDNTRKDAYWIAPAATLATLTIFIVYATWRAFQGRYFATYFESYHFPWAIPGLTAPDAIQPHYWSPFYSPYIPLHWKLGSWPISAALYVLIFPLSFRLSCYYCRKTYYRAIFQDPGACAVRELLIRRNYTGETKLPSKLFNFHRFALYIAIVLVAFHWKHLYDALFYSQNGATHFGIGLGTLVLAFDTLMLSAYTFSCHSFRHLIGGIINRFSRTSGSQARHGLWAKVSLLNNYHGLFFWLSLCSVVLADLYVYLVSSGILTDPRLIGFR